MTTHEQNPSTSQQRNRTEEQGKTSEMKQKAQAATEQVSQKARETTEQAKEQTRQVAEQAKGEARSMAQQRKGQISSEINSIARAFRSSGQQLRMQDEEPVARYATQIADSLDNAASYINERSVDDILSDAEDFARRRPEVFLGGAFGLGLLVSRFFKSSERNLHEGQYRESGYYRSGDYRRSDYYEGSGSAYAPASYGTGRAGTSEAERTRRTGSGESTLPQGRRDSTTMGGDSS